MFALEKVVDPRCNFDFIFNAFNVRFLISLLKLKAYFDRYRNTKILVINTAGDEFFLGVIYR